MTEAAPPRLGWSRIVGVLALIALVAVVIFVVWPMVRLIVLGPCACGPSLPPSPSATPLEVGVRAIVGS